MKEHIQRVAELREKANFLGYEFLSWLFLLLDRENAKDEITELVKGITPGHCSVVLGQRLVTCLLLHKEQKTSVVSPLLEDSHEVFASLKNGHVIEALSLAFLIDETKITLGLNAYDFALSQTKITANFERESVDDEDLSEDDQKREEIFLRMAALADAEEIIDRLYRKFVTLRLNRSAYSEHLRAMRTQVEERLGNYLKKGRPEALPSVFGVAT